MWKGWAERLHPCLCSSDLYLASLHQPYSSDDRIPKFSEFQLFMACTAIFQNCCTKKSLSSEGHKGAHSRSLLSSPLKTVWSLEAVAAGSAAGSPPSTHLALSVGSLHCFITEAQSTPPFSSCFYVLHPALVLFIWQGVWRRAPPLCWDCWLH